MAEDTGNASHLNAAHGIPAHSVYIAQSSWIGSVVVLLLFPEAVVFQRALGWTAALAFWEPMQGTLESTYSVGGFNFAARRLGAAFCICLPPPCEIEQTGAGGYAEAG